VDRGRPHPSDVLLRVAAVATMVVAGFLLLLALRLAGASSGRPFLSALVPVIELLTFGLGVALLIVKNPYLRGLVAGSIAGILLGASAFAIGGEFVVFVPLALLTAVAAVWNAIRRRAPAAIVLIVVQVVLIAFVFISLARLTSG
jgi:hypothetical protein